MTVIRDSEDTDPRNESSLPYRMASSAAMKNVLSPISEANMSDRDAKNPDLDSGTWKWLNVSRAIPARASTAATAAIFPLPGLDAAVCPAAGGWASDE